MSDQRRHIAVGLTVVIALALLAGMIVVFTGLPSLLQRGYTLQIACDHTYNAQVGDPIRLAGMRVGSILSVDFSGDDPRQGVTFIVAIRHDVKVPANVTAYVHSRGFVGSGYIELRPDAPPRVDPETGKPMDFLPTDRVSRIEGRASETGGLIPDEITNAVKDMRNGFAELGALARNLNRLVEPLIQPPSSQGGATSAPQANAASKFVAILDKLGQTLDTLNATMGDRENQGNLKKSLQGLAKATEQASDAMKAMKAFADEARTAAKHASDTTVGVGKSVDRLARRLVDNAEKISALATAMNRTVTTLEGGKGSLGRLLNDPKLYNNLAEATDQLAKLVRELRELTRAWKADGVKFRLK